MPESPETGGHEPATPVASTSTPRLPHIRVNLSKEQRIIGRSLRAFEIVTHVRVEMRVGGCTAAEIARFTYEAENAAANDLIAVVERWVTLDNTSAG